MSWPATGVRDYEEKAMEQARVAVEHFKEDFIYKIRSAIKEAISAVTS